MALSYFFLRLEKAFFHIDLLMIGCEMKIVIYVFSGTGNTSIAARKLASCFNSISDSSAVLFDVRVPLQEAPALPFPAFSARKDSAFIWIVSYVFRIQWFGAISLHRLRTLCTGMPGFQYHDGE